MKSPSEMSDDEIYDELKFLDSLNNISVGSLLDGSFPININDNYSVTARGELFKTDVQGIIAQVVDAVYQERVAVRALEKKAKLELEACNDPLIKKELENKVLMLYNEQVGIKILINSLYGAFSNQYFRFYDERIAESITLTGQLTIKWIEKELNKFFNELLKTDNIDYIIAMDTDSVVGDTVINVNDKKITIKDYFDSLPNNFIKKDDFNENYIKIIEKNDITPSVSKSGKLEYNKIKYIMKHKVKKKMYRRTDDTGNSVVITEDHSIIVQCKSTQNIFSIKPHKLSSKKHKIINIIATDTDRDVTNEGER